jgi:CheY-like chemotaxis protein
MVPIKKKSIKILLIEDNEGDIILTRETLKEGKISNELICIKDGESAIDFLVKIKSFAISEIPDLVLLDINLPRINGHEVMDFINKDEILREIPVFMLSSSDAQKDVEVSIKNNAHHYLFKPLDLDAFMLGIGKINSFWLNIIKIN